MSNTELTAGRTFAERILAELQALRTELTTVTREVGVLNEVATLMLRPMNEREEGFATAAMRLLTLVVAGTEETHKRLEAMAAAMVDSRITTALRSMLEH